MDSHQHHQRAPPAGRAYSGVDRQRNDCLGRGRQTSFALLWREILRGIRRGYSNTNCNCNSDCHSHHNPDVNTYSKPNCHRNSDYNSHAKRDPKSNLYAAASGHTAAAPDAGTASIICLGTDASHKWHREPFC